MSERRSNEWLVESLRFSVFLPEMVELKPEWWKTMTGEEPVNRIQRPGQAESIDDGPFMGGLLQLRAQLNRIDFFLMPISGDEGIYSFPNIGEVNKTVAQFQVAIEKWLEICELEVLRLAFGMVVLKTTAGKEETYEVLQEILPFVKVDTENWQELVFQVNQPKLEMLDFGEIKFNRLIKSNGVQAKFMFFSDPEHQQTMSIMHAARIELDINTDQDNLEHWGLNKIKKITPHLYNYKCFLGE